MIPPDPVASQNPEPPPSRQVLLRSAAFGAGFAATVILIVGGLLWYSARPKPLTPWNATALLANEPPRFSLSHDGDSIEFTYSVENTTDLDYHIERDSQIRVTARSKDGTFSQPLPREQRVLELPVFIPAKQKALLTLRIVLSAIPERDAAESDEQYHEQLRAYCDSHIGGVGEFVVFDDVSRYQINLPRWRPGPPKEP